MKPLAMAMALVCLPALYAEMERAADLAGQTLEERYDFEQYHQQLENDHE